MTVGVDVGVYGSVGGAVLDGRIVGMSVAFDCSVSGVLTIEMAAVAASVGLGFEPRFCGEVHPKRTRAKIAQPNTLPGNFTRRTSQQFAICSLPY